MLCTTMRRGALQYSGKLGTEILRCIKIGSEPGRPNVGKYIIKLKTRDCKPKSYTRRVA